MKFRHLFSIFILVFILFVSVSCSASDPGMGMDSYAPSGGEGKYDEPGINNPDNPSDFVPEPGQITVCAYNDNEHFEFWYSLSRAQGEEEGSFSDYHSNHAFKTLNRIHLILPKHVTTKVNLLDDDNNVIYTSYSDKSGNCYLFSNEKKDEYKIELQYYDNEGQLIKEVKTITGDTEFSYLGADLSENIIQLMFVIDATGSMGDEMDYLKSEVADIISRISNTYSEVKIELAILMYRDHGDDYVTRYSDFTADIDSQQAFLTEQKANGGGDFEEAVDVAMLEAAEKQWRQNSTNILIHIADAPSHDQDVTKWNEASLKLSEKGVRIITVASSGINKKTEYFFRSQSMLTNGHYVYLTNDSGIGNDHLEGTVEERPTVEYLNSCLIRLIKGYYSGLMEEAIYYKQER